MKYISFVFFAFLATTFQFSQAADWPQLGFNTQHTAHNPFESVITTSNVGELEVLWENSVPCTINHEVSVVNDVLYYGHYCGEFRAVDAATGALKWSRGIDRTHTGQVVVDGVVYVSSRCTSEKCGNVYAFDAATGTPLWHWVAPDRQPSISVVYDSVVYVWAGSGIDHKLFALDAATGAEIGSVDNTSHSAVDSGVLFTVSSHLDDVTESVWVRELPSRQLLWSGEVEGTELSLPVVSGGRLFVSSDNGYMYVFDAGGCGETTCSPLWRGLVGGDAGAAPAVDEDRAYVGKVGAFVAFNVNGCGSFECTPVWTAPTECDRVPGDGPSVANGVLYTTCGTSHFYAFDAGSGEELWSLVSPSDYSMRGRPVIVDGRVFYDATFNFKLYAFHVPGAVAGVPVCDIQLNQTSFVDGDTIIADVLRFENLSDSPVAFEVKIWMELQGMHPVSAANFGSDGSYVLPASTDVDAGPLTLASVTATWQRGRYEFSCRMLDPITGELFAEDRNFFDIQ